MDSQFLVFIFKEIFNIIEDYQENPADARRQFVANRGIIILANVFRGEEFLGLIGIQSENQRLMKEHPYCKAEIYSSFLETLSKSPEIFTWLKNLPTQELTGLFQNFEVFLSTIEAIFPHQAKSFKETMASYLQHYLLKMPICAEVLSSAPDSSPSFLFSDGRIVGQLLWESLGTFIGIYPTVPLTIPRCKLLDISEEKGQIHDIRKIALALHKSPFILISHPIPAFVQALVPEECEKLAKFKSALECFRMPFERSAIGLEIQDKIVDPFVQIGLENTIVGIATARTRSRSITLLIDSFSQVARGEKVMEKTFVKQGIDWLITEIQKAREFRINEGPCHKIAKQRAIEKRNAGELTPIQEFLLIDLSEVGQGVSLLDTKVGSTFVTWSMQACVGLFSLKLPSLKWSMQSGKVLPNLELSYTRSISDCLLDQLREKNPHSLLFRFLDFLEGEEKEKIWSKIRADMIPFLVRLISVLESKHQLEFYKEHFNALNFEVQSGESKLVNRTKAVEGFVSIFQQLLRDIDEQYGPAIEAFCEAFWEMPP